VQDIKMSMESHKYDSSLTHGVGAGIGFGIGIGIGIRMGITFVVGR